MNSKKLILASGSPRRKELLAQAGFNFDVQVADIDEENYPAEIIPLQLPIYLAEQKARKIISMQADLNVFVLAADSLVFLDNLIFTKPKDRKDAIHILQQLEGKGHTVITGVCLMNESATACESVHTEVFFESMSQDEIEYYIDTFKPYDKAGAYGIQDWIGLCKVKKITGSFSNIMGLPMETVYKMLKRSMNT